MSQDVSVRLIIEAVTAATGVSRIDLLSKRNPKQLAYARHIAMWLARKLTLLSYPAIARQLGDRDHTTVMNGVSRIDELRAADPDVAAEIDAIEEAIARLLPAHVAVQLRDPDPAAVAERIVAGGDRAAIAASTMEIVAMAQHLDELVAVHEQTMKRRIDELEPVAAAAAKLVSNDWALTAAKYTPGERHHIQRHRELLVELAGLLKASGHLKEPSRAQADKKQDRAQAAAAPAAAD